MQICALWSDVCASTSSQTCNDVLETIDHEFESVVECRKSRGELRRELKNEARAVRPAQQHSMIYALICLLLILTQFGDAAPVYEKVSGVQGNGLQDSLIYSSLLRSSANTNPLNTGVVIVRKRRSSTVTPSEERELIAMTEKKSYPRICYFSPIQCLFSSSSGSLSKRRR